MAIRGRNFWAPLAAMALVLGPAASSIACPNCVRALSTDTARASGNAPAAFNASILFMLAVPFSVAGFFGWSFWRLARSRPYTGPSEFENANAERDRLR